MASLRRRGIWHQQQRRLQPGQQQQAELFPRPEQARGAGGGPWPDRGERCPCRKLCHWCHGAPGAGLRRSEKAAARHRLHVPGRLRSQWAVQGPYRIPQRHQPVQRTGGGHGIPRHAPADYGRTDPRRILRLLRRSCRSASACITAPVPERASSSRSP